MDTVKQEYRKIIEKLLLEYEEFLGNDDISRIELVFDRSRDRYLLTETGWQNDYRVYGTLLHLDIIDDKIWIQHDGTEDGIADELVSAGIPKDKIVLAYYPIEHRKIMDFAIC